MKNKFFVYFLSFIFVFLIFNNTSAQEALFDPNSSLPIGVAEQISIDILPKIPNPGDSVSISVQSYSTNFNAADFVWTINGVTEAAGKGIRNFSFSILLYNHCMIKCIFVEIQSLSYL